ncbi:MAG: hypothetical protein RI949_2016 [Pseudomonadota bacterium]|jgi:1-deoxy-D-xylulose-5-phosphate reductoisomerase
MIQRICILGSTGSIGVNTLDVADRHPDRFEVFGLTGHRRMSELAQQCARFKPKIVVVPDAKAAQDFSHHLADRSPRTEVWIGPEALVRLASAPEVDVVMAAIVGAAGLRPCMAAARAGKKLLLANKEALVVGGGLFMQAVEEGGCTLVPIDSEHSAIFQCLPEDRAAWERRIDHIVLTASGGPFRQRDPSSLGEVTPQEACAHPNWVMGQKISVDSATMMNKALEVIEARWLFNLSTDRIKVVIHPQSIIHSMVVCRDESVLAQLGTPDMRVPIAYGMFHPERLESGASRLDFMKLKALTFEEADDLRFPGLKLAYQALEAPMGACAVMNAANEEAVAAFLRRDIRFTHIHEVNRRTLEELAGSWRTPTAIDDLLELDGQARRFAAQVVKGLAQQ